MSAEFIDGDRSTSAAEKIAIGGILLVGTLALVGTANITKKVFEAAWCEEDEIEADKAYYGGAL